MNNGLKLITGPDNNVEPNTLMLVNGTLTLIDAEGQQWVLGEFGIAEQATLVAGTKAIAVPGVSATSKAFAQLAVPNTVANTVQYKVVCTANTVTITALIAAGTINAADVSTLNVLIFL